MNAVRTSYAVATLAHAGGVEDSSASRADDFLSHREKHPNWRLTCEAAQSLEDGTHLSIVTITPPVEEKFNGAPRAIMKMRDEDLKDVVTYLIDNHQQDGADYKELTMALHYLRCAVTERSNTAPGLAR